jgi:hypothetical protein
MADFWQQFTDRARLVVFFAQEEAERLGENYISTEHLLLGLVREHDSVACRILERMGVSGGRVRSEIEKQVTKGSGHVVKAMTLTPRAKRAVDFARDVAWQLDKDHIGTEHLLLGLVSEDEGLAGRVLSKLGVDLERTHREVSKLYNLDVTQHKTLSVEQPAESTPSKLETESGYTQTQVLNVSNQAKKGKTPRIHDLTNICNLDSENKQNIQTLNNFVKQKKIIPFIGAGMSASLGYPGWYNFLKNLTNELYSAKIIDKIIYTECSQYLKKNNLIELAGIIYQHSHLNFNAAVKRSFGRDLDTLKKDIIDKNPAVRFLPQICSGPIITTNFDRVIETIFEIEGQQIAPENIVLGAHRAEDVLKQFTEGSLILLKLHGDFDRISERVFTLQDYEREYSDVRPLPLLLGRLLNPTHPLLFLGCSLAIDRTMEVLQKYQPLTSHPIHFALLKAPCNKNGIIDVKKLKNQTTILNNYTINPIWFNEFEDIDMILGYLADPNC